MLSQYDLHYYLHFLFILTIHINPKSLKGKEIAKKVCHKAYNPFTADHFTTLFFSFFKKRLASTLTLHSLDLCRHPMPDIGFWNFVKEKMPDSRFLTQNHRFSFNELVQASSLPSFVTDLSEKYRITPPGRIYILVSDPNATVTYYLICRKESVPDFKGLFDLL